MLINSDLLLQSVSEGVLMLNPNGYIIYCNPAASSLTGYPGHELLNLSLSVLYPIDNDLIKMTYELSQALKNGHLVTEGWKVKKDQTLFWAVMTVTPIYDKQTDLAGYCCLLRDDSDQKNEQIALRQREERFRLMVENVQDYAIFMLDVDGYILTWNEGAKRTNGYTSDEIIGRHFSTFYIREDLESQKPARELKIATETGKYEEEGWRVKKNGSVFWANVVITALFSERNQLVGFSKVTRDLTERKASEESLRLSEELYRSLVEQVVDYGIFMMDEKGRIVSWNEGAKRINGYSEEEVIGKYFTIFYPEEDIRNSKPATELKVARETGRYEEEGWRIRKDGSLFWANIVITAVYNSAGTLIGFSKVSRDLTERQQTEKALRESHERYRMLSEELKITNDELATINEELAANNEEYAALNEELEESNALLIRSNENLQTFAYVASHDLQEPLRKIQQFGDLLKKQVEEGLEPELDFVDRMQSAANRMSLLIKDLLAFSRISIQQNTSTAVSLDDIVNQVRITLELPIQESDAQVNVEPLPTVWGDASQLGQLFQNLMSNALKFHQPDAKPRITIRSGIVPHAKLPPSLRPARQADEYHHIEVIDNGIGFDEKYLGRIFQVFQRLHNKSEFSGTGIGLAICEKVVTNHGGAITASSQLGQGATFSVYLPL
ncbi:PAS domain-containing sensor histidine kinase [Larkinella terrae]|uniref:histidine kinase n=1 Tax=Larkinella terrae TaxID=2025311 RepID=A0A7K0EE10_9BACT|nr:PAS domain S-box protein [Larkinella terrae]MRS59706.1 PAS domain S-box protein [Larkinella terrae]